MVQMHGLPLEKAILPASTNGAKSLGLYPQKGALEAGSDADIVLLDDQLNIKTVIAMGKVLLKDGKMQVYCNFEDC
jgi:beta-aspartyl-dipeptidase (metallo-type)